MRVHRRWLFLSLTRYYELLGSTLTFYSLPPLTFHLRRENFDVYVLRLTLCEKIDKTSGNVHGAAYAGRVRKRIGYSVEKTKCCVVPVLRQGFLDKTP